MIDYNTGTISDAYYYNWLDTDGMTREVLVEADVQSGGTETTRYLSVLGFTTGASDTPANQHYLPVLIKEDLVTTEQLSIDGNSTMTIGDVPLNNIDRSLDPWLKDIFSGRGLRMYLGSPGWTKSNFRQIANGTTEDIDSSDRLRLNLKMRDKLQRLNGNVTETLIGGTGSSKDAVVPTTFGQPFNVTPVLVDQATLKYRVHGTTVSAVIEVRDNGVPVVFTDNGDGTFTLSQAPEGAITCDVSGDTGSGAYIDSIPDIVQRLATAYGPAATRLASSDMDTTNLSNFKTAHPQPVNKYLSDRANVIDVCRSLAASVGAQPVMSRTGLLRLLQIDLSNLSPTFAIDTRHILEHTLHIASRQPVAAAVKLGFAQNYTVQTGLMTGIPANNAALYAEQWPMSSKQSDDPTRTNYRLPGDPALEETDLSVRTDADAEASRRLNLRKVPRMEFRFDATATLFRLDLGQQVSLQHSDFNLSAGVNGMVTYLETRWAANRVTVGVLT